MTVDNAVATRQQLAAVIAETLDAYEGIPEATAQALAIDLADAIATALEVRAKPRDRR